ncbi:hypothetical protein PRSY57_0210000, partial [Plasmodium reichenowi]|jgi:hypothetical protein
MFAL